jgi:hypothetical protein
MHLRSRLKSLKKKKKNCLHNLTGVPNTGSSGITLKYHYISFS